MEVLGINSVIHGTPTVATIGFFDGVHLGHKFLLDSVADEARRNGKKSVVVTFVHNPKSFSTVATIYGNLLLLPKRYPR